MSMDSECSTSSRPDASLCAICTVQPAVYTCPRCAVRTCSLPCSTTHKTLGEGCSGIRNKAAYVPMNQYGYMALMDDYVYLEEIGRKVGDWGREIVHGGYGVGGLDGGRGRGGMDRGRSRGRGRGAPNGFNHGKTRTKRDILKTQLDFRDIEMDLLPNGMERRTLNQSTWDFKNKTALLTLEFHFHPPRDPLAPSSQPPDPPFTLLTHRNTLETSLLTVVQSQVAERNKSKRDKASVPPWLMSLISPEPDEPDSFIPPTFVMRTQLDPLAALHTAALRPGHILRSGYYKLDPIQPLATVLKHKQFVEFPIIEVWEEGAFRVTLVDDEGALLHEEESEPRPKRRRLSVKEGKKAINGLLGGYGSEEEDAGEEERSVLDLLGGYAGSDDENSSDGDENVGRAGAIVRPNIFLTDAELGDEDAEGETDDEGEADGEQLAGLLLQLRDAGALRDVSDGQLIGADEEQIDWGDSGDEHVEE